MGTEGVAESPWAGTRSFSWFFFHLSISPALRGLGFSHHVADEETEDQRGYVTSPKAPQLIRDRVKI